MEGRRQRLAEEHSSACTVPLSFAAGSKTAPVSQNGGGIRNSDCAARQPGSEVAPALPSVCCAMGIDMGVGSQHWRSVYLSLRGCAGSRGRDCDTDRTRFLIPLARCSHCSRREGDVGAPCCQAFTRSCRLLYTGRIFKSSGRGRSESYVRAGSILSLAPHAPLRCPALTCICHAGPRNPVFRSASISASASFHARSSAVHGRSASV